MRNNDYYNNDDNHDGYYSGDYSSGDEDNDPGTGNGFDYGEYHKSVVGDPIDDKMKERYNELSKKQIKVAKIVISTIFSLMGAIWIALGVTFKITGISENGGPSWYIFAGFGGVWLAIAVLVAIFMKAPSYEKMKKRTEKYYGYSSRDYGFIENKARTDVLEERVKELEEEVNRLKDEK